MDKRIYISAALLHQCQREKNLGALDALAFCLKFRFIHRKAIIYKSTDIEGVANIGTARKERIIANCIRLGLVRKTKHGHYELLPIKHFGENKIPVNLPYNVCEMKITDISNILSLHDLANQICVVSRKRRKTVKAFQRGVAVEKGRTSMQVRGQRYGIELSYRVLAEMMNVSERTVIRYVKQAADSKLIRKTANIKRYEIASYVNIDDFRNSCPIGFAYIKGRTICIQYCNSFSARIRGKKISISRKKSSQKIVSPHKRGCSKPIIEPLACVCAREGEIGGETWCKENYDRVVRALAR